MTSCWVARVIATSARVGRRPRFDADAAVSIAGTRFADSLRAATAGSAEHSPAKETSLIGHRSGWFPGLRPRHRGTSGSNGSCAAHHVLGERRNLE